MSNEALISAPGKLFLLGEYSVLYGKPAIVLAVDKRISAHLEERGSGLVVKVGSLTMEMAELAMVGVDSVIPPFKSVVASMKVFEQLHGPLPPLRLETRSDVPVKGLGSSGASIVSTLGALHLVLEGRMDEEELFREAYQAKILFEGFGSASDVAASVFGGVIKIEDSRIERCPSITEGIVACYSGVPASTEKMYQVVSSLARNYPDLFESLLEAMEGVTARGLDALRRSDYVSLGALMSVAHGLLESLGVGHQELCRVVLEAEEIGALGAKLSGAGGGDCALVLEREGYVERLVERFSKLGKTAFEVKIAEEGVRKEDSRFSGGPGGI